MAAPPPLPAPVDAKEKDADEVGNRFISVPTFISPGHCAATGDNNAVSFPTPFAVPPTPAAEVEEAVVLKLPGTIFDEHCWTPCLTEPDNGLFID